MGLLAQAMPDVKIELDYGSDLDLLVAVVLSAQCTDKRVNMVTPALFARCKTPQDYATMKSRELQGYIKTCGLYRNKARNIIKACRRIVSQFGGQVPRLRKDLEKLPGVGHKSAGVVVVHLGSDAAFPVDTHVGRLARRMDFTRQSNPDKVEIDLTRLLPPESWAIGHQLLVWHGRRVCLARSPRCDLCPCAALCPRKGVKPPKVQANSKSKAKLKSKRSASKRRAHAKSTQPATH